MLGLKKESFNQFLKGAAGVKKKIDGHRINLQINSGKKKVAEYLTNINVRKPKNIPLCDPNFNNPDSINCIIRSDNKII